MVPGVAGGFWDDNHGAGWGGGLWDPGHVVTDEFVKFETSLWDGHGSGKLVWSATMETENPSSGKDFTGNLIEKIIPGLMQAGFVPRRRGEDVSYAPSATTRQ
jgi:hypothetical protein